MSLVVHLLGRPRIEAGVGGDNYQFRSRKSSAVLAYLLLSERPPSRAQLASLLFSEADDPLRALRWNLSEIRHCLGAEGSLDGDPLILCLPPDAVVDVEVVSCGSWIDAVEFPGLGAELLEGVVVRSAAAFDSWLLSEQRRVAAASEAILHEAAVASMSRGALDTARDYAIRAAAMSPLDENHQALLIRLYRLAGQDEAAHRQFAAVSALLERELGVAPGRSVQAALRQRRRQVLDTEADQASIDAIVEAGSAAVAAGAVEAGIQSLRSAVALADGAMGTGQRVKSRLVLAEALIHSLGGQDEEGLAILHEADRIALTNDDHVAVAHARAEVGFVDFLRAQYSRAEHWLIDALQYAHASAAIQAKATTYLGAIESDRANYPAAIALLQRAIELSRAANDARRESYVLAMLGRISLLRGELTLATEQLDGSICLAEREHWLAFLPWPQSILGGVQLAQGNLTGACDNLLQAYARSCQLGDPCWEAISSRGLALVADASGETDRAFALLADARKRCNRFTDPYVWLDVYILDAQCELGCRHGHPDTRRWIETMRDLASRSGMRELTVRSMLHGAAVGKNGDAAAAALLAADIDNPVLARLVA